MADKKISQLSTAASLTGAEAVPLVQSGATLQATVYQLQTAPMSALTANTVMYLNGSKVPTSSTGLVFDGTNLCLGVTPSAWSGTTSVFQNPSGAIYSFSANSQNGINSNAFYNGANWIYRNSTPASDYFLQNGQHVWRTAPSGTAGNAISFTQAMTLDASGNLGVGTTSPSQRLAVINNTTYQARAATATGNYTSGGMVFGGFGADASDPNFYGAVGYDHSTGKTYLRNKEFNAVGGIVFETATTGGFSERARITSGGDWLVNTTSVGAGLGATFKETVVSDAGEDGVVISCSSASAANLPLGIINTATSGNNSFAGFYTEATPTIRGSISYNRAGALVNYGTTSDYRAKDIIGPVQNPGATIDALKVYEGVMKGATQSRPMLIAHEAQAHAPYAVSGVKDEVNEDGTPKFQQMDVSSLVPLLLAEIQSLRARVAALEAA